MKSLVGALVLLITAGCASWLPLPRNPGQAIEKLKELAPIGTSQDEVEEKVGFQLTKKSGAFGTETFEAFMYYAYFSGSVAANGFWEVAIVLKNERVSGYSVRYQKRRPSDASGPAIQATFPNT